MFHTVSSSAITSFPLQFSNFAMLTYAKKNSYNENNAKFLSHMAYKAFGRNSCS